MIIKLTKKEEPMKHLLRVDEKFKFVYSLIGNLEYSLYEDRYRFLVDTIIGQMLSNKVADVFSKRLEILCGGDIIPSRLQKISEEEMRSIGLSRVKAGYIKNLTEKILSGSFDPYSFDQYADDEIIRQITSEKGFGNWSAKMFLIFVLNRPDVLPFEDGAFLQSYKWLYSDDNTTQDRIIKNCSAWRPYSSIAARYLYRILDQGYTKTNISIIENNI